MVCSNLWLSFAAFMIQAFPGLVMPANPCAVSTVPPPAVVYNYPASKEWMSEQEEVDWYNQLGFKTTLDELKASYTRFVVKTIDPNTSVLWSTESDELRNYYRLCKRTAYQPFCDQSKMYKDWMITTYSHWELGGSNKIEPSHIYLMGLIDWYVDHKTETDTLAAIERIVQFILQKFPHTSFVETRVHARAIQCLAYYLEKIGPRDEVKLKLETLIGHVLAVPMTGGFLASKYYVGEGWTVTGFTGDLRTTFPGNTAMGVVTSATTYNVKSFKCVSSYQDVMMMHALRVAARVLNRADLLAKADEIARGWQSMVVRSFVAPKNLMIPYVVVADAPEKKMFQYEGSSTPLYNTQFAAYSPDATTRKVLQQQALLRQYGQLTVVAPTELGVKPKYFLWSTWEAGFFLTQK